MKWVLIWYLIVDFSLGVLGKIDLKLFRLNKLWLEKNLDIRFSFMQVFLVFLYLHKLIQNVVKKQKALSKYASHIAKG